MKLNRIINTIMKLEKIESQVCDKQNQLNLIHRIETINKIIKEGIAKEVFKTHNIMKN